MYETNGLRKHRTSKELKRREHYERFQHAGFKLM